MTRGPPIMSAIATHLLASCTSCGAPQPLSLANTAGACAHCHQPDPLPGSVRKRLDALRAQLASRDEATRQLTASAFVEGDSLHGVGLITIVICWALFGGVGLYVALDHDVPLGRFLAGGEPAPQWWLLWAFVLGVALSLGLLEAAVARIRGLAVGALPAPPLTEGAPPRCRCCGAELPGASALRRCEFCRTDNLVLSGRYLKAQENADEALDAMAASFDRNLQARIDAGNKIAMAGGVVPFFLLFIGPAIGLAIPGQPKLWAVPAAMIAFALIAALVARLRRLPVEALELLTLGQEVYVREDPKPKRTVCAQLMGPSGPVNLLGRSLEDANLGVTTHRADGDLRVLVYRISQPTHPLGPGEREQLAAAEVWEHQGDKPPQIRPVWLLATATGWRTFAGDALSPHLSGNVSGKPPVIVLV